MNATNLPNAAYMCQWIDSALVQIMAWRLFGAKPLCRPMLGCCQLDPKNKLQWNFVQNTKLFIHENAYENIVWEMAAILSWGRWVTIPTNTPLCSNMDLESASFTKHTMKYALDFVFSIYMKNFVHQFPISCIFINFVLVISFLYFRFLWLIQP